MKIKKWTKKDEEKANKEGWGLFFTGYVHQIQRLDEPIPGGGRFDSDDQAINFVLPRFDYKKPDSIYTKAVVTVVRQMP